MSPEKSGLNFVIDYKTVMKVYMGF